MIASARRLTRAQLDAWATFGREWEPFKEAWMARGFLLPPAGSQHDDDEDPSQRYVLWQMLDAWPNALARWVREAPPRSTPYQVVTFCVRRWHEIREGVGPDEDNGLRRSAVRETHRRAVAGLTSVRQILRGEP